MTFDGPPIGTDRLDDAIGAIYDAATSMDRWPVALGHLRGLFNLGSTAYVIHDASRSKVERYSAEYDPEGHWANVDSLLKSSLFHRCAGPGRPGAVERSADLVPMAAFRCTPLYQQYWRPRDLHDGLRLTLDIEPDGTIHALNLIRPRPAGLFEAADITLAHRLMPHLRRSVALQRRLGMLALHAAAALKALDALAHGVLLLDPHGQQLHVNEAGANILSEQDGLSARAGRLRAATPALTNQLHAMLAAAAGQDGKPPCAGVLRLPRPKSGTMLALLAMPFRQDTEQAWTGTPAVLLAVSAPYATVPPAEGVLSGLFGLTAAEAALAVDLLSGHDLADLARRSGRSRNTLRTHLARLMAKTDTSRQSELVRRIAAIPALHPPR